MRIPFGTIKINQKAKKIIAELLKSNRLSCGKYVREFEDRFARLIGTKEAVAVGSGADAIVLALAVLYDFGAKRGDEIILPALSFVATGNAVLEAGFKPVFVDVERNTLNIDTKKIDSAITKKTRAIIPVHLMGKPAEMDTINRIAKKHKLYVIEDAAEAHGALYKGKKIGTLSDMSAFSLYVAHIISTVEGGIVTTNNSNFAEILRSLRSHGRACKCKSCLLNTASAYCPKRFNNSKNSDIRFSFERIGFSSKMNELEAAVGLGGLDEFNSILAKRRKNLYYLMQGLKNITNKISSIEKEDYEEFGPHAFAFIVQENAGFTRNSLVDYLERRGVDTRSLFLSMPTQCPGYKFMGYKLGDFPEAEYVGDNGIHIGVHQDMSKKHCDYFLSVLKEFLSRAKK